MILNEIKTKDVPIMYHTILAAQKRGFISKEIKVYRYPKVPNKYSGG